MQLTLVNLFSLGFERSAYSKSQTDTQSNNTLQVIKQTLACIKDSFDLINGSM
jgi:hypothetical protein